MKKLIAYALLLLTSNLSSASDGCKGYNKNLVVRPGRSITNLTIAQGITICENNPAAMKSTLTVLNQTLALAKSRSWQYKFNKPLPDTVTVWNYRQILLDKEFTVETNMNPYQDYVLDCHNPVTGIYGSIVRKAHFGERGLETFGSFSKSLGCWNSNVGLPRVSQLGSIRKTEKLVEGNTLPETIVDQDIKIPERLLTLPPSDPGPSIQTRELGPPPDQHSQVHSDYVPERELGPASESKAACCTSVPKPAPVIVKQVIADPDTVTEITHVRGRHDVKRLDYTYKKTERKYTKNCDDCGESDDDCQSCEPDDTPCCNSSHNTSPTTRYPATDAVLGRNRNRF